MEDFFLDHLLHVSFRKFYKGEGNRGVERARPQDGQLSRQRSDFGQIAEGRRVVDNTVLQRDRERIDRSSADTKKDGEKEKERERKRKGEKGAR